jgi:hypothetical protein
MRAAMIQRDTKPPSPEVHLWRAVIAQAIYDATMKSRPRREDNPGVTRAQLSEAMMQNQANQIEARQWLTSNDHDFREVCQMALLDPNAVHEIAMRMKDKGWPPVRPNTHPIMMDEVAA